MKDKIANTITISEYFNQLWTQPELKDTDKEFAIKKLEAVQQTKKLQIQGGQQVIAKAPANLDVINAAFKMTAFEEYNLKEKIEDFRQSKKLDVKITLALNTQADPEVLHALNKVSKSVQNMPTGEVLHYSSGLVNGDEAEHIKKMKAEEFVKKIKTEKKNFKQTMNERTKSVEKREQEEIERHKRREKEEEERKQKEKQQKLEAHIKELKQRDEVRQKEAAKWEEQYKEYSATKPMYKVIEHTYKKETLLPELEERKKKLKEIRDFHKPIAREELEAHEKKMVKALEEIAAKKEKPKEVPKYKKPEFESKYHQKIVDEATKLRSSVDNDHMERLKKKEKIMEYVKDIKEKHAPNVDPSKELEILGLIEKNKKKEPRSRTAEHEAEHENNRELRRKGLDYLATVKEQVQEHVKKAKEKMMASKDMEGDEATNVTVDKDGKSLSQAKSENTFRKRNYLAELRKDNKLTGTPHGVESILKNKKLDGTEKKELLQTEIEKLEEKAKRLEMLKKHKATKPNEGHDAEGEVDQIYINAIRAKLEMLGN